MIGQGNFCMGQPQSYPISNDDSRINFSVGHLGVLTVEGAFKTIEGTAQFEQGNLSAIDCRIPVKSIDTANEKRDETLLKEPYLAAKNFPFVSFTSSSIEAGIISGRLKIKGVERAITLPFTLKESNIGGRYVLETYLQIFRDEFELHFESMDALVGNEITLTVTIAIYKD